MQVSIMLMKVNLLDLKIEFYKLKQTMWLLLFIFAAAAQEYNCIIMSSDISNIAGVYLRNCECNCHRSDGPKCDTSPYNTICCNTKDCDGSRNTKYSRCLKTFEYCPGLTLNLYVSNINITAVYQQNCDCLDQECTNEIYYYINQTNLPCWFKDGQIFLENPEKNSISGWVIAGPILGFILVLMILLVWALRKEQKRPIQVVRVRRPARQITIEIKRIQPESNEIKH